MTTATCDYAYTREGRRFWLTLPIGAPIKHRIKAAGGHWDAASVRWWMGDRNPKLDSILTEMQRMIDASQLEIDGLPYGMNESALRALATSDTDVAVYGKLDRWMAVVRLDRATIPGEIAVTTAKGGSKTQMLGEPAFTGHIGQVPVAVCPIVRAPRKRLSPPEFGEMRRGRCSDCGSSRTVEYTTDMSGIPGWACYECSDHPSFA